MVPPPGDAFVPPPYPYERLHAIREVAAAHPGGGVDCSIGTPGDPVPAVATRAIAAAADRSAGYPPSIGTPELRDAIAGWSARRLGIALDPAQVAACVGTKELVASLPRLLALRDPTRDTVLFPAVSYPTYEMGARLAGLRPVPVPVDAEWHLDLGAIAPDDAARALVLWVNEPGNPSASSATPAWFAEAAAWARTHGVVLASDECYAEFAPEVVSALGAGTDGVLAVHSVSKRSNLAGLRVGWYGGDHALVGFLAEVRLHAGLMVPTVAQAAAAAALGDDEHVDEQRRRYRARAALVRDALAPHGLVHDGGDTAFYCWLRAAPGETRWGADGWEVARALAQRAGIVVAPGDLYGPGGAAHVRLALVAPTDRLAAALDRLGPA